MSEKKKTQLLSSNAKLSIYTASAGAGKTHTLTGRYLKLALSNPQLFRHIQAVTFTNKATAEMKDRILNELHILAQDRESGFRTMLMQELGLARQQLKEKAAALLQAILCEYSSFRIKTIDSFFQEVMRAFAYELGLNGRYSISFEQSLLLDEAVRQILQQVDPQQDPSTAEWIENLITESIEEGSSYNINRQLVGIGWELFKEGLSELAEKSELPSREQIATCKAEMQALMKEFEAQLRAVAQRAIEIIEQNDLELTDFSYKDKSAPNVFYKVLAGVEPALPRSRVLSAADPELGIAALVAKTAKADLRSRVETAYEQGLSACFVEIVELYSSDSYRAYVTAKLALPLLNRLGLVGRIYEEILALKKDKAIMLISDAPTLLNRIIDESETPFIYEKVGVRIKQQMIDEFQDTSRLQYKNFKPLLLDSLAQGNDNLVVGDVKQSIYRFRNADSSLLGQQVEADFASYADPVLMHENWRSRPEIVAFNNAVYPSIANAISQQLIATMDNRTEMHAETYRMIGAAYANAAQEVAAPNRDKMGYVRIFLEPNEAEEDLPDSDDPDDEEDSLAMQSWTEQIYSSLPSLVIDLQQRGYSAGDIAILVRKKHEATKVAEAFNTYVKQAGEEVYSTEFVSEEALLVNAAVSVRFIISLLRFINRPQIDSLRQEAFQNYRALYLAKHDSMPQQKDFSQHELELIMQSRQLTPYEQIDVLVNNFRQELLADETPYLVALLDLAYQFTNEQQENTSAFIKWWQVSGKKECISSADNPNAVNILTIHKSKGLGFKVVILPMVSWKFNERGNRNPYLLWCLSAGTPFAALKRIPIIFSEKMKESYFDRDYYEELNKRYLDSLNLLYVATTRAKDELYLWMKAKDESKKDKAKDEKKLYSNIHHALFPRLEQMASEGLLEQDELGYFLGKPQTVAKKQTVAKDHSYHLGIDQMLYQHIGHKLSIKLDGTEHYLRRDAIDHGILMHAILAKVERKSDIQAAVADSIQEGLLSAHEAQGLQAQLEACIAMPQLAPYYDGSGTVLNEQAILLPNGSIQRPDRIVAYTDRTVLIDYKFGEARPEHQSQLRRYAELLGSMGYPKPQAYLLYIEEQKFLPVALD